MTRWHTLSVTDALKEVSAKEEGLSSAEAAKRLEVEGPNLLPEREPPSALEVFVTQFQSPLIYLLLAASGLLFLMGDHTDSLIVLGVLIFNAVVGTVQEGRATHTLRSLKKFVETEATVLRDGSEVVIPDAKIVPGDIIILTEGDRVAADARVMLSHTLVLDESSFTGESVPVRKSVEAMPHDTSPAGARNMVYRGTYVLSGGGRALVVATGTNTVIGGIAEKILAFDTETPLAAEIRYLSCTVIAAVALVSSAIFIVGLAAGNSLFTMFGIGVSLAISMIPVGLPIVLTLVLTAGVWRMSKRNVLVKKMQAIEALGQARTIAVDKTGTITKNELVVRRVWTPSGLYEIGGEGYDPVGPVSHRGNSIDAANHPDLLVFGKAAALLASARISYLAHEGRWRVSGDPTEAALLVFGGKLGFHKDELLQEDPLIAEMPFDYSLQYHAAVHRTESGHTLSVGGAPEALLHASSHILVGGTHKPITSAVRAEIETAFAALSHQGLRVIALAVRDHHLPSLSAEMVSGLTFLGLVGMQDALRAEVPLAMARTAKAGIRVVMVTGDHKLTALAIAKEAGIVRTGDTALTGVEIDALSDTELMHALPHTAVFARVTPEHKLRIVKAFRARHEVVAMTGDGVNDAPSLVAADLGVAMGKVGTEVAKEAADLVLLDDNFGTIVSAIEEGRSMYITIKKVILYLFTTSTGEAGLITVALLLGYPLPLLAAQIIWLNLVTDGFLDVALAMEPKEKHLLSRPVSFTRGHLIDSLMLTRIVVAAVPMILGTLYIFHRSYDMGFVYASTMVLTTFAAFQWFNAWNCRSDRQSIFTISPLRNGYLIGATLVVILLQFVALYTPFLQEVLRLMPLTLADWSLIIPIAFSVVVVEELRKALVRTFFPVHPTAV